MKLVDVSSETIPRQAAAEKSLTCFPNRDGLCVTHGLQVASPTPKDATYRRVSRTHPIL